MLNQRFILSLRSIALLSMKRLYICHSKTVSLRMTLTKIYWRYNVANYYFVGRSFSRFTLSNTQHIRKLYTSVSNIKKKKHLSNIHQTIRKNLFLLKTCQPEKVEESFKIRRVKVCLIIVWSWRSLPTSFVKKTNLLMVFDNYFFKY